MYKPHSQRKSTLHSFACTLILQMLRKTTEAYWWKRLVRPWPYQFLRKKKWHRLNYTCIMTHGRASLSGLSCPFSIESLNIQSSNDKIELGFHDEDSILRRETISSLCHISALTVVENNVRVGRSFQAARFNHFNGLIHAL